MSIFKRVNRVIISSAGAAALALIASSAGAYDGTNCKAPGNCWEPKPGYPAVIAGSKYDPKHDPMELNKQQETIQAMEERNRKRVEHLKKTGEFIYDVSEIPAE
ncbi:methanol dehydrogenase [Phyllobacterium phragmitis]|uniref:Methanol dehydrogenase [cytochrome c] subunit 2 n=1 Tax=Phyllobacterium phragmitis TaxID=2670329 RepID=A0A2S9IL98_9HYPH|nr:methanol dehydrogenase [cytochrome c] subunit [Phyllobacterium phragmitis]PRD41275.1 methanol dehydrogenase [Phyllobacterium phragmitis]